MLVIPNQPKRLWREKIERLPNPQPPSHDAGCALCPGNRRADGTLNPDYKGPFAFTDDFAALPENSPQNAVFFSGLLQAKSESGICRIISFSPNHSLSLPELSVGKIRRVVGLCQEEFYDLSKDKSIWIHTESLKASHLIQAIGAAIDKLKLAL